MFNQAGSQSEGGFFNDTSMYSPTVSNDRKKPESFRKQQSIAHATIKQLMNSTGDFVMIGSHEIAVVQLLVKVKSIEVTSVKTEYVLEDETGMITAVSWTDDGPDESTETLVVENSYCMVAGTLRSVEDKKSLMVLQITPVTDPNQVTEHLLSIVHNRLKAQIASSGLAPTDVKPSVAAVGGAASYSGSTSGNPTEIIMQFITATGANIESGVNKKQVIEQFGNQFTLKKIDEVLTYLCTEGQLYTTVDDDHFKSTDE